MPFQTEHTLHIRYKSGWASFAREEALDFAPYIGLDILDDGVGQFTLFAVAWCSNPPMFLCQGQKKYPNMSLQELKRMLARAGWIENKEVREPLADDD